MPTILVVDDEAANRLALERILVREGLDVSHASDGRAALERLRSDRTFAATIAEDEDAERPLRYIADLAKKVGKSDLPQARALGFASAVGRAG